MLQSVDPINCCRLPEEYKGNVIFTLVPFVRLWCEVSKGGVFYVLRCKGCPIYSYRSRHEFAQQCSRYSAKTVASMCKLDDILMNLDCRKLNISVTGRETRFIPFKVKLLFFLTR